MHDLVSRPCFEALASELRGTPVRAAFGVEYPAVGATLRSIDGHARDRVTDSLKRTGLDALVATSPETALLSVTAEAGQPEAAAAIANAIAVVIPNWERGSD